MNDVWKSFKQEERAPYEAEWRKLKRMTSEKTDEEKGSGKTNVFEA